MLLSPCSSEAFQPTASAPPAGTGRCVQGALWEGRRAPDLRPPSSAFFSVCQLPSSESEFPAQHQGRSPGLQELAARVPSPVTSWPPSALRTLLWAHSFTRLRSRGTFQAIQCNSSEQAGFWNVGSWGVTLVTAPKRSHSRGKELPPDPSWAPPPVLTPQSFRSREVNAGQQGPQDPALSLRLGSVLTPCWLLTSLSAARLR